MEEDRLRRLQDAKLHEQIAWVYKSSAFYRERMNDAGVTPDDVRSVEDLVRLPIMEKTHYRSEQEQWPPYGRMLCVDEKNLVRYWTTSGSTGKPTVFGTNLADYEDYLESAARVLWTAGVRPGWKVAAPFSHGHWIGLWGVFDASWLRVGAQIVPLGGYDTKYRIAKIAELSIDALIATPTYAAYLSEVARQEGIDVRSIGVKAVLTAGEPVAPSSRQILEETWGAPTYDFYGNTENLSYLGVDCPAKSGFHFWEDRVVTEIVDVDGRRLPDGEEGDLVFTNLTSRSMPAIRLRIGDVTKIQRGTCSCGRTHLRVQYILGRRENVLKVRGINVYPRVVEDVIRSMRGLGSEYRLVFRRQNRLDTLTVQIEPLAEQAGSSLMTELREAIRTKCSITPIIEALPHGTLPTSETKAKRVVDERGADEFKRT